MTELLYQEDSYLKEAEATIKNVDGKFVILDKSIFIPAAGGLPPDNGVITSNNEIYRVVYAIKKDDDVSLEIDKEGLKVGDKVNCELDWERRYKIMRYHTAIHALSSVIHKNTKALITGNQISLDQARIDFSLDEFDKEEMIKFIEETNRALNTNQQVEISYMLRREAEKQLELARLAKGLPDGVENLRIVQIGDIDKQADGGPHVKNTSEVPELEFLKAENKGKNNRRLYFKLGL